MVEMVEKESETELAILIPTLNEEEAIGNLVEDCKKITENIIVIDGLSTDYTIQNAQKKGADILICKEKGKGTALVQGFKYILENKEISYVAYIDGDNTYDPGDIKHLYNFISEKQKIDIVIGNRFPKRQKNTITRLNMIGNKFFSILVSRLIKQRITDTQSGLRIISRNAVEFLSDSLESKYFEIETEMIMKAAKKGFLIDEKPIEFYKREGETKLNPIRDGFKILKTIMKNNSKKYK